ncbi:MAG TPA: hypothetical protein VFX47_04835 [Gammaproteobacteria bacterium]|nr:hypothetical protein [Gammaproteobacteria bacterium]
MVEQHEPELVVLARRLGELANERTEQSSERSYLNSERNLAVLIHAAVVVMILGLAIDRYQLLPHPASGYRHFMAGTLTGLSAAALIGLGALMSLVGGVRYLVFILAYRRRHVLLLRYGPLLAPVFALLVAGFGVVLLAMLFGTVG